MIKSVHSRAVANIFNHLFIFSLIICFIFYLLRARKDPKPQVYIFKQLVFPKLHPKLKNALHVLSKTVKKTK